MLGLLGLLGLVGLELCSYQELNTSTRGLALLPCTDYQWTEQACSVLLTLIREIAVIQSLELLEITKMLLGF